MNVLRVILFPIALVAALIDSCYEIFWYCVIVGRPDWIVDRKETMITAVRDLLRDMFIPHRFDLRTCCYHCDGDQKCAKCPVHGRRR